eukprot:GHVO01032754.1.p1 GENE.GHVO01032754.1~~GHVO01032754.1.p1  ORF type:complete len:239 (+),score=24.66 GHVO01032754.1:28-717(+)
MASPRFLHATRLTDWVKVGDHIKTEYPERFQRVFVIPLLHQGLEYKEVIKRLERHFQKEGINNIDKAIECLKLLGKADDEAIKCMKLLGKADETKQVSSKDKTQQQKDQAIFIQTKALETKTWNYSKESMDEKVPMNIKSDESTFGDPSFKAYALKATPATPSGSKGMSIKATPYCQRMGIKGWEAFGNVVNPDYFLPICGERFLVPELGKQLDDRLKDVIEYKPVAAK